MGSAQGLASPDIVDDACNYAWMEFLRHQPDRDGSWKAWLVTTAQRDAWKRCHPRPLTRRFLHGA